jgi:hypothetical protein
VAVVTHHGEIDIETVFHMCYQGLDIEAPQFLEIWKHQAVEDGLTFAREISIPADISACCGAGAQKREQSLWISLVLKGPERLKPIEADANRRLCFTGEHTIMRAGLCQESIVWLC